ncbi:hypothetical protein [Rhizobium mongolense]|uniref:hypothetical protein n=1 Tax=Rhizobium mongolense TaxID=57676 RepID=UPI001F31609C|nr:hypothetical protein [Rhizobium mongolense]
MPIRPDAVVGVTGFFDADGKALTSVGIHCAVCHSTVDDAYAPGIGARLDGWPNRDLNIGAIVALAPDLSAFTEMLQISEAEVKKAIEAWGPGKFDAELNSTERPSGRTERRPRFARNIGNARMIAVADDGTAGCEPRKRT